MPLHYNTIPFHLYSKLYFNSFSYDFKILYLYLSVVPQTGLILKWEITEYDILT